MKKGAIKLLAIVSVFGFLTGCQQNATPSPAGQSSPQTAFQNTLAWKEVRPGLTYANLSVPTDNPGESKDLIMASVDPQKFSFGIYQNKDKETAKTIREIHKNNHSLLTFNGTFFTKDFKSTGFLLSDGKALHELSTADLLNGIFAIGLDDKPHLITDGKIATNNYSFAIQSGPMLINEKGIIAVSDKSSDMASRTAIGIDKDGHVTLIILKQSLLNIDNQITLYKFAKLLKDAGPLREMGLHSVLNLDGGSSTGLMIEDWYYPEMEKVQNAVIVKEKPNA
jgi:uncharacterized protein YigE (DUF2233 family)